MTSLTQTERSALVLTRRNWIGQRRRGRGAWHARRRPRRCQSCSREPEGIRVCAYVAADGELWQVSWPEGLVIHEGSDPVLRDESGRVIAREGDTVGLNGRSRREPGPLCMAGTVFDATELAFVEPGNLQLDPATSDRAEQTALEDPLLADYVARHPHADPIAEQYQYPAGLGQPERAILVTLRFFDLADDYPLGSCDIARPINRAIGSAWLIYPTGSEILARSPIWPEDIRCF